MGRVDAGELGMIAPSTTAMRYLDYSALSTYAECARKGQLKYEHGWSPRATFPPIHAGRAGHEAVYELHANGWDLERALGALRKAWGSFKTPAVGDYSFLTLGHMELVIREYHEQRREKGGELLKLRFEDLKHEKIVAHGLETDEDGFVHFAECPLVVQLADDVVYGGKLDFPEREGSLLFVNDFKFTTQPITDFWAAGYLFSHQMRNYVNMMRTVTGLDFAGVRIIGVPMGKRAVESKRPDSHNVQVFTQVYPPGLLAESVEWARHGASEVEWRRAQGVWTQNDKACRRCEMKEVCRTTPAARGAVLNRDFTRRELNGILASGADSDDH